ncbi:MAG: AAA family ATPase [Gammaproteobacteria bacterium]|nr:AAA family ATPase [Gammaproteobacteria bacterium]
MYTKHFGLTEEPFSIAANPRFLYMSASHREALGHLLYGIGSDSGFVLLTGEVGTGKTTVCRCLLQQLPENTEVAYILNPKVSAIEMLGGICDEIGVAYPASSNSIKELVDAINRHLLRRHADGKQTVVIIDEAQNLSFDVLEQLRLLTNLETDERKLLRIILIGQPELATMLASPELKQVEQRITARYYLKPLQRSEIGAYVSHRLAVAGRRKVIFPPRILPKLYAKTRGIPRLINVICDRAMLGAYVNSQTRVNSQVLNKAAEEVQGRPGRPGWLIPGTVLASVLLVGVATAAVYFYENPGRIPGLLMPSSAVTLADRLPLRNAVPEIDESRDVSDEMEAQQQAPVVQTDWPEQLQPGKDNLLIAQKALFQQWGLVLPNNTAEPCAKAETAGLRCFSGVGNLGSIIGIDRPAILTLVDSVGQQYHATLLAIVDKHATIAFSHGVETVSIDALEARWRGQYQLLWRMSPQGYATVRPGRRGKDVSWLTTQLIAAGIDTIKVRSIYDAGVVEAVKIFQRDRGLVTDGIAGRQTLMRLSSQVDKSVPKLSDQGAG